MLGLSDPAAKNGQKKRLSCAGRCLSAHFLRLRWRVLTSMETFCKLARLEESVKVGCCVNPRDAKQLQQTW